MIDSTPSIPGVLPGMTLEQGLSIHSDALVIEADEPHYRGVFTQILTSLQQISDRVEDAKLGTAYVRLDGLEHLHGGESRLVSVSPQRRAAGFGPESGRGRGQVPRLRRCYGKRAVEGHSGAHCRCSIVPCTSSCRPAPRVRRPESCPP